MTPNTDIYCVYRHIRPDKDEPFYIGIGETNRRPTTRFNRNIHWNNIYNLNNKKIEIDILEDGLSWEESRKKEVWWIAFYGRNDLKKGPLCNLTNGGEGTVGMIMSKEHRKKIADANIGNLSNTGKIFITNGKVNKLINKDDLIPNNWYRGKLQEFEWSEKDRDRMSKQRKGKKFNLSAEQRIGRSERAMGNKATSGNIWINNGVLSKYIKTNEIIPEGWKKGRRKTW